MIKRQMIPAATITMALLGGALSWPVWGQWGSREPVPVHRSRTRASQEPFPNAYEATNSWPAYGGEPLPMVPPDQGGDPSAGIACPTCPMPTTAPLPDPSLVGDWPAGVMFGDDSDSLGCDASAFFIDIGGLALTRQKLGSRPLALLDPAPTDDGILPPRGSRVVADFNDLEPYISGGARAAIGFITNEHGFEAAGFYIPEQKDLVEYRMPGRLTSFFFNPPLGFEGNNLLWDNADTMRFSLKSTLGSGEINYRFTTGEEGVGMGVLVGARYIDLQEELRIRTDDDVLQYGFDPTRSATYTTRTHNHLMGGQAGLGGYWGAWNWFAIGWEAKGAWFANHADLDVTLRRGDGLRGRRGHQHELNFAHAYEFGAFVDLTFGAARLRAGYMAMWILDVAEAVDQVDYNLENRRGRGDYDGDVFYHGPTAMLEIIF